MARMANRMTEAAARFQDRMSDYASSPITYTRGATVLPLSATKGATPYDVEEGGVIVAYMSVDFIVRMADLSLVPAAADVITDATGTYQVGLPNVKGNPYQILPGGISMKIHTKKVG